MVAGFISVANCALIVAFRGHPGLTCLGRGDAYRRCARRSTVKKLQITGAARASPVASVTPVEIVTVRPYWRQAARRSECCPVGRRIVAERAGDRDRRAAHHVRHGKAGRRYR